MTGLINTILPFFGLILLGFLAGRFLKHEENGLIWLNRFVIYAALPPLIFQIIRKAPQEGLLNLPYFLGTVLGTGSIFIGSALLLYLLYKSSIKTMALQGATASYGNIGYIGLPLCVGIFGAEAAVPAVLVFCFDNTLQFVFVPFLTALGSNTTESKWKIARRIILGIILHPFILATIAGLIFLFANITLPQAADNLLSMLERAAGPCALFALGVTVSQQSAIKLQSEYLILIIAKLFVHPLLTFLILSYIGGFDKVWMGVALLMASLPTASNVFVMASDYNTYKTGSSNCILISTALSFFTIMALLIAIETNSIPQNLFGY